LFHDPGIELRRCSGMVQGLPAPVLWHDRAPQGGSGAGVGMNSPGELVEHLFRRQAGRMVAALVRIFGPRHLQLAEDVVQEALVRALERWPIRGIPANPTAWLIEVAKNRALDALRRESSLAEKTDELIRIFSAGTAALGNEMDDQLAMMFL